MEFHFQQLLQKSFITGHCGIREKQKEQINFEGTYKINLMQKEQYSYFIVIQNIKKINDKKSYDLQEHYQAHYEPNYNEREFIFYIPISKTCILLINCKIEEDNFKKIKKFRELYCRCIYQQKYQEDSKKIKEKVKLFKYIKKISGIDEQIQLFSNLFQELKKNGKILFFQIGIFQYIKPSSNEEFLQNTLIYFKESKNNIIKIIICDEKKQKLYQQKLNEDYFYELDIENRSLVWINKKKLNPKQIIYCFFFESINIEDLQSLKKNLQNLKQTKFKNSSNCSLIFKDLKQSQSKLIEQIHQYENNEEYDQNIQFSDNSCIVDFQQLKQSKQLMLVRQNSIQLLSQSNLNIQSNCQISDSYQQAFTPLNIHFLQDDSKFVCMDLNRTGKGFLIDLETQKIIDTYQDQFQTEIVDISVYNEKDRTSENQFLSLSRDNIQLNDTRMYKPVIFKKYASIHDFSHIFSPSQQNYIAVTEYGDIRCYNQVGKKAVNKLDKYGCDRVQHLDSNKKGDLILVTFSNKLYLYAMNQGCQNAFRFNIRRNIKPQPFNLTVCNQTLRNHNVNQYKIKSAKFDEKQNQNESQIIAVLEPDLIVSWNLQNILNNGDIITQKVQKLNNKIVKGEFLYNTDKIVTAFDKFIQFQQFDLSQKIIQFFMHQLQFIIQVVYFHHQFLNQLL